jgi:GTP-binding protein
MTATILRGKYTIADSGGLVVGKDESILVDVRHRVEDAVVRSDIIIFVVEYDRITTLDETITQQLRRSGKTIILVGNKADNMTRALEGHVLMSLGFGEVIMTSPVQRRGIEMLRTRIAEELLKLGFHTSEPREEDDTMLKLAIIGRPNVGKSSIVNAIS